MAFSEPRTISGGVEISALTPGLVLCRQLPNLLNTSNVQRAVTRQRPLHLCPVIRLIYMMHTRLYFCRFISPPKQTENLSPSSLGQSQEVSRATASLDQRCSQKMFFPLMYIFVVLQRNVLKHTREFRDSE